MFIPFPQWLPLNTQMCKNTARARNDTNLSKKNLEANATQIRIPVLLPIPRPNTHKGWSICKWRNLNAHYLMYNLKLYGNGLGSFYHALSDIKRKVFIML